MELLKWNQINSSTIFNKSGIYAWYYNVSLGDHDICDIIKKMNNSANDCEKSNLVKKFLDRHFYSFFKESMYKAELYGKLMPKFVGELYHVDQVSSNLVNCIIENPTSLWEIKRFISNLSIEFSSPIYIGMADNLSVRLNKHKNLIEKFKEELIINDNFEDRDENFAARVVSRKMIVKNLKVSFKYSESDKKLHSLFENLMNRINYPVLGRN